VDEFAQALADVGAPGDTEWEINIQPDPDYSTLWSSLEDFFVGDQTEDDTLICSTVATGSSRTIPTSAPLTPIRKLRR
jgi:hypothetical protein